MPTRMRSQLEDLRGLRRGTVRIACSQALAHDFLPRQIGAFRKRYPLMTFEVMVVDHERAMGLLVDYVVDLILVFRPPFLGRLRPIMTLPQRLVALMNADHPLARKAKLRLADCTGHPLALPGILHRRAADDRGAALPRGAEAVGGRRDQFLRAAARPRRLPA